MKKIRTVFLILIFSMLSFGVAFAKPAPNERVDVRIEVIKPYILANQTQTVPVKISLEGLDIAIKDRAAVNIAVVLDRSGSMSGAKLERAKSAAKMAVNMLGSKDIFSLVVYDTEAQVLVPATRVTNKQQIISKINSIYAGDSTALFAGVSLGSQEIAKFLSEQSVNRVVLLSDGLANVGPSSPSELGNLGRSLAKEGVSVSTIGLGLGYNEDLMTQLAGNSDGNHLFIENENDLITAFNNEFGTALNVVAKDINIHIDCEKGVRPVNVLGREAEIYGSQVRLSMNQLYQDNERYVIVELEVPAGTTGEEIKLADIDVSYNDIFDNKQIRTKNIAKVHYTSEEKVVLGKASKSGLQDYFSQQANKKSTDSIKLRDAGRTQEWEEFNKQVSGELRSKAKKWELPGLSVQADALEEDIEESKSMDWNTQRKGLKERGYQYENQQRIDKGSSSKKSLSDFFKR